MMKQRGFTLIEVLIFATVLSIFFIIAAASINASLNRLKNDEYKILATHYAQELSEWLKFEKEADWNDFIDNIGTTSPVTKSFHDLSWSNNNEPMGDPPIFTREATFTEESIGGRIVRVNVRIKVYWRHNGNVHNVSLSTILSVWE